MFLEYEADTISKKPSPSISPVETVKTPISESLTTTTVSYVPFPRFGYQTTLFPSIAATISASPSLSTSLADIEFGEYTDGGILNPEENCPFPLFENTVILLLFFAAEATSKSPSPSTSKDNISTTPPCVFEINCSGPKVLSPLFRNQTTLLLYIQLTSTSRLPSPSISHPILRSEFVRFFEIN